jgi:pimeloyl-ACP methyl ester carboxylesterase
MAVIVASYACGRSFAYLRMIMTISQRSIEIMGTRQAFLEAGAGWPVILLHAFPLSADMWRPQLEHVPDGWRFIAPDLRGFGPSVVPPKRSIAPREGGLPPKGGSHMTETRDPVTRSDSWRPPNQSDSWHPPSGGRITMDDYAADVLGLMDALELDDAVIGGLSMGGYVAFAMHRLAPSRFAGMVLADTRPQADSPQALEGRLRLRAVLAADGPAGVADQMLPKLLGETTRRERPEIVRQTRALIESASREAIDAAVGALMTRPDSTPGLESISCAALVLVGEQDEIAPLAEAEAMQRAIRRSTLSVIPGAGHLSSLERPDVFSRGLSDFLRAVL